MAKILLVLGFSGLNLSGSCMCCQSLWVHVHLSPAVSVEHCLLRVICHLCLLESLQVLFYIDPWGWKEGADKEDHPWGPSAPQGLTLCTLSICESMLILQQEEKNPPFLFPHFLVNKAVLSIKLQALSVVKQLSHFKGTPGSSSLGVIPWALCLGNPDPIDPILTTKSTFLL